MTLKSSIRETEHRIAQRRGRLGAAVDGVRHSASRRMVSPGALIAAGLFGAALHQNRRLHGLQVLALLQATNAGLRRVLSLLSWTRPAATG